MFPLSGVYCNFRALLIGPYWRLSLGSSRATYRPRQPPISFWGMFQVCVTLQLCHEHGTIVLASIEALSLWACKRL